MNLNSYQYFLGTFFKAAIDIFQNNYKLKIRLLEFIGLNTREKGVKKL